MRPPEADVLCVPVGPTIEPNHLGRCAGTCQGRLRLQLAFEEELGYVLPGHADAWENAIVTKAAAMTGNDAGTCIDLVTRLRAVLRGMPGPVALITTRDAATGQPAGLAASAVIPVSMAPPSMLVCVNRAASAHAAIEVAGQLCINLIGATQTALVEAFSNAALRDKRFTTGDWDERHGLPYLPAAPASLFCAIRTTLLFGTHEVFVGEVFDIIANGAEKPVAWLEGAFARCSPIDAGG